MKRLMFISIFVLVSGQIHSQDFSANGDTLILHLSKLDGNEKSPVTSSHISSRVKVIALDYTFPNRTYLIEVNEISKPIPSLSVNSGASPSNETPCETKFTETFAYILTDIPENSEKKLENKINDFEDFIKQNCPTSSDAKENLKELQNKTRRNITHPINMSKYKDYEITVSAQGRVYKFKFEGKERGQWVTSYGFMFSPKAAEPHRYYIDKKDDEFIIKRRTGPNWVDLRFTPGVFFSWFPEQNFSKNWNWSFSGGIGVNTESPVASLALNAMFNQNIGFSIGGMFYEQSRLNSKYKYDESKPNDLKVSEDLSEDQLYEKSFFRPNFFISINFRFGENPFKKASEKDE